MPARNRRARRDGKTQPNVGRNGDKKRRFSPPAYFGVSAELFLDWLGARLRAVSYWRRTEAYTVVHAEEIFSQSDAILDSITLAESLS